MTKSVVVNEKKNTHQCPMKTLKLARAALRRTDEWTKIPASRKIPFERTKVEGFLPRLSRYLQDFRHLEGLQMEQMR